MGYHQTQALVVMYTLFFGEDESEALPVHLHPTRLTWIRNSDRLADEAEFTIDARQVQGLDPRAIYSARVEVYCDDLPDGARLSPNPEAIRFFGYVDEVNLDFDGNTDTLSFKCRDYTALLIDQPVPRNYTTPTAQSGGKPGFKSVDYNMDVTFEEFVRLILTQGSGRVGALDVYLRADSGLLYIDPAVRDLNLAAYGIGGENKVYPSREGDSLWDILCQVSDRLSVVPVFERDMLYIKRPSDHTGGVYHMAYGTHRGNLKSLTMKKDLAAGVSRKIFEVICLRWMATGAEPRVVKGQWPITNLGNYRAPLTSSGSAGAGDDPSNVARGGSARGRQGAQVVEDEVVRYTVDGDYTEAQLTDMARYFYEEAARSDIQGTFATHDCLDLGWAIGEFPNKLSKISANKFLARPDRRVPWPPFAQNVGAGTRLRNNLRNARDARATRLEQRALAAEATERIAEGTFDYNDPEFNDIVEVRPAPRTNQADLMTVHNSALVLIDTPPPLADDSGLARNVARAIARSRQAVATVIEVFYVKKAEHQWDAEAGYSLTVDFTSVVGADVGGPTAGGSTREAQDLDDDPVLRARILQQEAATKGWGVP